MPMLMVVPAMVEYQYPIRLLMSRKALFASSGTANNQKGRRVRPGHPKKCLASLTGGRVN